MAKKRKFCVWLDSGANVHSKREEIISLDDLGFTSDEWDALSEEEKDKEMREVAWEHADWGFHEIG